LSITIPRSSGWILRSNNGRAIRVEKNKSGFKDAVLVRKNLLFSTLGSQITNHFVWKSKAGQESTHSP